jgi:ATP-dependent RNA helicase RhlE
MSFARLGPEAERISPRGLYSVPAQPTRTPSPLTTPTLPLTFEQLGLAPELLRAVAAEGYTEPTPVQAQSIPIVLAGRDILSSAQTGTGKTAAFVLPILQLLNASRPAPRPVSPGQRRLHGATGLPIRCLVLTPTRELALQIEESVRTYGREKPVKSTTIYGGVGFQPQVLALRHGPEIVVATPGRLLDHAGQGTIDLSSVEILVLDEADRMLDMGFVRDIRRILALLPAVRQNLLFSATFSDEIRELAGGLLNDAAEVQVARRNAPIELVRQVVHPVDRERKRELLSHLIRTGRIDRALVFTRTKHGANRLAEQLGQDGIAATAIHGNKSQSQRVHALDDFKSGRVAILVATEIAARGLDIDGLPHVVNFELPTVPEDYVHRIGRTGRAGLEGDAVSLVCIDETSLLDEIQSLLRQPIRREIVPGFEVDRSIRREPIRQRSNDFRPATAGRRQNTPHRSVSSAGTAVRPQERPAPQGQRVQAPMESRPPRRPAPAPRGAGNAPQNPPVQGAKPNGFNLSSPVEPRRGLGFGYRRPVPGDFDPAGSTRPEPVPYRPARPSSRPAQSRGNRPSNATPARQQFGRSQNGSAAPGIGAGAGRPAYPARQAYTARPASHAPMSGSRPAERRDVFVSMPGERISREGKRPA